MFVSPAQAGLNTMSINVARHTAKMAMRLKDHLKLNMLDGRDPITALRFLPEIQMICDTNDVHEDAAMSLSHFLWKNPPLPPSTPEHALRAQDVHVKKHLIFYFQFVNDLLNTWQLTIYSRRPMQTVSPASSYRTCTFSIIRSCSSQSPNGVALCMTSTEKRKFYWGLTLIDKAEYEELWSEEQRSFPPKTRLTCPAIDKLSMGKLVIA